MNNDIKQEIFLSIRNRGRSYISINAKINGIESRKILIHQHNTACIFDFDPVSVKCTSKMLYM